MAEDANRAPVSSGRIVTTAVFHAFLLVLFVVFLRYIVPGFAATTQNAGAELPASAKMILRTGDFLSAHWFWMIPLAAAADTAVLFTVAKSFGKRGLLVWSVLVSGIFASVMILGMIGLLNAVAGMG